ncbi:MAG: hypothetical protein JW750_08145 [Anaerolineaceae bacterium]|nr:hypothetical protein [Anaerolineaceae bacterium]
MFKRFQRNHYQVLESRIQYVRFIAKLPRFFRAIFLGSSAWWEMLINSIMLSMIWLVCSATVVLFPPATFGLYYALRERDRLDNRFKLMFEGAKKYAGQSYLWFLFNLIVAFLGYVNVKFYSQLNSVILQALLVVIILVLVVWIAVQIYAILFLFRQEKKNLFFAYRNGFFLFMTSPLFSIGMLMILGLLIYASAVTGFLLALGAPVWFILFVNYMVADRLIKFELIKPEDSDYYFDAEAEEEELKAVYDEARAERKERS